MSDELKPCPWCRKAPTLHYSDITEEWHVYCNHGDCMVRPYVFKLTKAEVIEAWNARADDAPISEKPAPSLKESTEDTQVLSDSREQLLVDAWKFVERWAVDDDDFCRPTTHLNCSKELRDLLDRQDAITRREFDGECEFCQSEVARLQNHVDDLKAEVEAQRKRANDAERGVLSEAWYVSRDRYEDDIAELRHANSLLQSTIAELGVKVDEKQAELLEARASCKADSMKIQVALVRFAEEWINTDTRTQELRCVTYHAQQIAQLMDNHTENA